MAVNAPWPWQALQSPLVLNQAKSNSDRGGEGGPGKRRQALPWQPWQCGCQTLLKWAEYYLTEPLSPANAQPIMSCPAQPLPYLACP
jgi:hypothetical protein